MDAYDIFKKLTKGLTFKHRVIGVKNGGQNSKITPVKKEPEIKEESSNSEEDFVDCDLESNKHQSESENPEDGNIQLIEATKERNNKKKKANDILKEKLELEEHNRFRNAYAIRAVGRHIPPAIKDFSELVTQYGVSQALVDTLYQCGYSEPTPIQRQAIPCMLQDRQVLACAPTGSGKTAAFLLPLAHALVAPAGGPRALVLVPTRELAHQMSREALRLLAPVGLRCTALGSLKGSKLKERESTFKKSDIVISTPNRLCYLLNQDNVNVTLSKVQWLIVDEADKLFEGSVDQASDFRQQLEQIICACDNKWRRVSLFSATHTPTVARWTRRSLRGLINITVGQRNAATSLVQQELLYCGNESGKLLAFRQLLQQGIKPPVLVFVQSKDRAKQLFKELIYDGINVDVIHADRTQTQRDNVIRSFRVGRIWVLICTELMGRGIDFRGVNLVINYDFPPSAITYIHRIGRAGRAGQSGRAVTFFTQDDVINLRSIASVMKQSGCQVPEYMLSLKQDKNKRKNLMKKAPHRDEIATILDKRTTKRKLEDAKTLNTNDKAKDTDVVNHAKSVKNRKIERENNQMRKNKKNTKENTKQKPHKKKTEN